MIGVVGGGIAGLAAAYRLQQRGHEVTVFEASDSIGGLAAVYETAGDPIEKFYHHLSKTEQTIVDLAEDLDVGDDVEWHVGKNAYYVDGTVYPMDTPWQILAFPPLTLYDKFRLAMLTFDVDLRGGVPSLSTYDSLADFEHQSAVEFAREHTTENVYESFFEPLLDAKFGERKDEVSAAWLLGRIKFRGERDLLRGEILGYFDGGFGRFLDALVDGVGRENVALDAPVTDVHVDDGSVTGLSAQTGPEDGQVQRHDCDAVVVATMPNVLESLTGYACDVEFQGTVCSVIAMDESLTDTYWLNVADEAPFGALIEHTNFVSPDRYGGDHLLYAVKYVQDTDDPLWQLDDEGVEETWLDGIADLFPEFDRGSVDWIETARNPRTAPVYEQGYLEKVIPYDLGDAVADGVYYAGMASKAQYPERSLNGGVVAGYECADRIDDAVVSD